MENEARAQRETAVRQAKQYQMRQIEFTFLAILDARMARNVSESPAEANFTVTDCYGLRLLRTIPFSFTSIKLQLNAIYFE